MEKLSSLEKLRKIACEIKSLSYEDLACIIESLSAEEIVTLSGLVGYPVFIRLCMGRLAHIIPILQDGAAIVIADQEGNILLQRRADRDQWGLPGGCQEAGESFSEVIIRETKEETNLIIKEEDLHFICPVSGETRKNSYPNGDIVYNNTMLYYVDQYSGELQWDEESKEMRFFPMNNLPENQNDPDLIDIYKKWIKR